MGRTRKQVGTSLCYDTHLGAQSTSHEEIRGPLWCAANARAQCQQSFFCPWIGCSPFTTLRQWYSQLQYTHTHRVSQSILCGFGLIWIDLVSQPVSCQVSLVQSLSVFVVCVYLSDLSASTTLVPARALKAQPQRYCLSMQPIHAVEDRCFWYMLYISIISLCGTHMCHPDPKPILLHGKWGWLRRLNCVLM